MKTVIINSDKSIYSISEKDCLELKNGQTKKNISNFPDKEITEYLWDGEKDELIEKTEEEKVVKTESIRILKYKKLVLNAIELYLKKDKLQQLIEQNLDDEILPLLMADIEAEIISINQEIALL